MSRPVIVDTDGGVDDAVALWWALTDPSLDVVAITVVWGNVEVARAADAVLQVVHAAGRGDVPVAVGRAEPFQPAPDLRPATFIHGEDGLGEVFLPPVPIEPVAEDAVDLLTRMTAERPGEIALVTIGPLTNIGAAVRADS